MRLPDSYPGKARRYVESQSRRDFVIELSEDFSYESFKAISVMGLAVFFGYGYSDLGRGLSFLILK